MVNIVEEILILIGGALEPNEREKELALRDAVKTGTFPFP